MSRFLRQLFELWKHLGLNQRITLSLAAIAIVAVMAGVLVWSSRPDLQLLWNRLEPKDVSEIVGALDEQGVKYRLGGGGTSVYVPREQVDRLRADLMARGLNSGGVVGYEIFDRGNFGISDFVQRTNNLRAIQGELSRTISQLDGVRSARVMVVMPENRLLVADANRRSTASVLVDTAGRRLAGEAVNSIRSLVANAVEGLKLDDVVVVDNRGNVLSEELRSDNLGNGLTVGQIRYRAGLEDYFRQKVESMLGTVLGPGNAVVRVSVDVDHTSSSTTEERFDPDGQVVRNSTVTEDVNTSVERRETAGGTVGIAANAPGDAGGNDAPVTNSQQKRTSKTENFEIARSTTSTVRAAGEIRRVTAAVFVAMRSTGEGDARQPQPRTPEEMNSLRTMVVNALGVTAPAGRNQSLDQFVSVEEVDFATDPVFETAAAPTGIPLTTWIELGQKVLVVVLALAGFIFFLRMLRRSQTEAASLELYNPPGGARGGMGELPGEVTPEMLNAMIREKPGNVGLTLKRWMSAEQQ